MVRSAEVDTILVTVDAYHVEGPAQPVAPDILNLEDAEIGYIGRNHTPLPCHSEYILPSIALLGITRIDPSLRPRMPGPEARFLRNSADLGHLTYHAPRLV